MFALIQSKNYVSNKGKSVGRYQYGTHPTRIGLNEKMTVHFGCKATKKINSQEIMYQNGRFLLRLSVTHTSNGNCNNSILIL